MLVHLDASWHWQEPLTEALTASAVRLTPHESRADLVVVAGNGTPPVPLVPVERDWSPHLPVWCGTDGIRVGPLVHPPLTACPGCVHAHERERIRLTPMGPTAEPDPALLRIASGLVAHQVRAWLDLGTPVRGAPDMPLTWSTVVLLAADASARVQRLGRHPHCGCTWMDHQLG